MYKNWNPWHGCQKYSEGCLNCYVYRSDEKHGRDSSLVVKTGNFDLPIRKRKDGTYKVPSGSFVWTCFSSDFFVQDADVWRQEAWDMIRTRNDCHFLFITKRIKRFWECIPSDWNDGWNNVTICVTCENQKRTDERLPFFNTLPIKHKMIINEPLLEKIDLLPYLNETIIQVVVGGESGLKARICDYDWILNIKKACEIKNVSFVFKQTGAFFKKGDKVYRILRKDQHSQARKANINYLKQI
jgi:protein gp37